jgi:hypothetical protein
LGFHFLARSKVSDGAIASANEDVTEFAALVRGEKNAVVSRKEADRIGCVIGGVCDGYWIPSCNRQFVSVKDPELSLLIRIHFPSAENARPVVEGRP